MKSLSSSTSLMTLLFLSLAGSVKGGGYLVLTCGVGQGGTSSAGSIGGEGGWHGTRYLSGLGLAVIATGSDWVLLNDNPVMTYEEKRIADAELYGAGGMAVSKNLFVVGTIGRSFVNTKGRSTAYGGTPVEWQGELHGGQTTYSGQLQHRNRHFLVGGGYHNSRGLVVRIGTCF
jgi:hypothetical protein